MKQTWRWFGPPDRTSIDDILQAGASGIVSALHHVEPGGVWSVEQIKKRKAQISKSADGSPSGLNWEVAESLPVSEDIKKQTGDWRLHIENYKLSLHNLADQGIGVVCYNFMPVLDWTRTDLKWRMAHGGTTMRFDLIDFAAFDIHILRRHEADEDFTPDVAARAAQRYREMSDEKKRSITNSIACGLPGSGELLTLNDIHHHLAGYDKISPAQLRRHLLDFLEAVIPTAEKLGLRLCCHPDDPPFPLLGLPRIVSTEDDYGVILRGVDARANGIALCAGSLGARPDNDLPGMVKRLGERIHFVHLRNVTRQNTEIPSSFYEADHLDGDIDMVVLIKALLQEEEKRRNQGREDWNIPMRPDHGMDILDDLERGGQPGYPTVGRLKGMAELRGVIMALSHRHSDSVSNS